MRARPVALSLVLGLVALFAFVAACDSSGSDASPPDDGTEAPLDPFNSAVLDLSERLGIAFEEITVISSESRQWPNACLGLPGSDEVCAEVITPGYRVVLEANGERYTYRTNRSTQVRLEEEASP